MPPTDAHTPPELGQNREPGRALRERFQRGDPAAFAALCRPEIDDLYTVCLRILRRPEEAEDAAQEALERALRSHQRYDPGRAFRPWLLTIAVNLCRDRMRTPWWRRMLGLERAPEPLGASVHPLMEDRERDRRLHELVAALPPAYREAIALYHLEGMSYREMSEILNISPDALKQRVHRASEMLRTSVEKSYPEYRQPRTRKPEISLPLYEPAAVYSASHPPTL